MNESKKVEIKIRRTSKNIRIPSAFTFYPFIGSGVLKYSQGLVFLNRLHYDILFLMRDPNGVAIKVIKGYQ